MSRCQQVGRAVATCLRQQPLATRPSMAAAARAFSSTTGRPDDAPTTATTTTAEEKKKSEKPEPAGAGSSGGSPSPTGATKQATAGKKSKKEAPKQEPPTSRKPNDTDFKRRMLDPEVTTLRWAEKLLVKRGTPPVGSRRRRVAIRTSQNIPFDQLPLQCFQEARKILVADRQEKLAQIAAEMAKIRALAKAEPPKDRENGEHGRQLRLASLREYVERLKILADINDPEVKRRFEDGLGDMNKPIYRHLAEKKWRSYALKLIKQRIDQYYIVPDLLPKFEPNLDVQLTFRQRKVSPGDIVDSLISERPPTLRVQCFTGGERLVTVAVVDSDVPLVDEDGFARRCHFLAANIPLHPARPLLPLGQIRESGSGSNGSLAAPWLPPFAQKGSPYHRLSVFVLDQKDNKPVDAKALRDAYGARDGFSIKSLRDKFPLVPAGFTLFRAVWDDHTADVMARHDIPGADVELRHARVHSLKPPRKARGWEAKRQGPKYRHLWKYTHRIGTPKRKFVR
ncbi:hypothetical protein RB598_006794 [Gaeumannomyces tritici]